MTTYRTNVLIEEQIAREPKQKLTLGINKTVIERAKAAEINISAITEQVLIALTYHPSVGNTDQDVLRAYNALVDAIIEITADYSDAIFEVGAFHDPRAQPEYEDTPILFQPYFGFYSSLHGGEQYRLEQIINHLYDPSKILSNLVSALIEAAEKNKKKIKELEYALRFVKVLEENEEKKD